MRANLAAEIAPGSAGTSGARPGAGGSQSMGAETAYPPYARDTETLVARIPTDEIGYVAALFESYEGIALVRTRDPQSGIIEMWVIPEFRPVFDEVLRELRSEIPVEILDIPPASRF